MAYACLLCQLNRAQEASILLKSLIEQGYETVKVNMLMSIAFAMSGDALMADKYNAISNLEQLRAREKVLKAGSSYEFNFPKSSAIMQHIALKNAMKNSTKELD